jgi:serine/threonine protein phosphatase PrpC
VIQAAASDLDDHDPTEAGGEQTHHHETPVEASPLRDENEKSKTFRKRRLSITKHQVQAAMQQGQEAFVDTVVPLNDHHDHDNETLEEQPMKKRRMSDVSYTSAMSNSTVGSGRFKAHIHHAGPIMRPPHSPSVVTQNRLYAPPYNIEHEQTAEEMKSQPSWRRRMTRRHSEDETKLPFPRKVVGQYSCHGIEPIYDSEYEQDPNEDEDDDDDWLNEASREDDEEKTLAKYGDHLNEDKPEESAATLMAAPKMTASAKINQDRGGVAYPYANNMRTALFAVYDGHGQGGELVAQFALHNVQKKLRKHVNYHDDIEKAFKDTFIEIDEELKAEPMIEPMYAGTTACVALLRDNKLIVSNTGDSRAVLARRKKGGGWETIQLSEDQNPDTPEEQARIEYYGGYVSPPPGPGLSARVWLDHTCTQVGLAMARSIGDHAVKVVGVIAEPVVTQQELKPDDDLLILASDGVWEFISSEEAVDIVGKNIEKGASKACQLLIEAAANKWHEEEGDYRDDITALVIRLQNIFV